jgi:HD-GYP domain-containing protein (c-di-GMP phosphodiesterase class II)
MEHEQKVATLLAGFSTYLNFSESEVRKLYLTAIVHDIGKIAIPEVILNKPGHLSKEEYTIIKRHPVIGSAILGEIDGFLQIATIVRHHHERFDGRGYPEGLAGDKIHLYSKMLAVCDSFDAMTSKRCYRNANTVQQALQEINECSGTQFDPKVCTMFIEYIKTKIDNTESA